MKVHKSENILPRFIAISVIPAISKKSGRAGICHSLCDRFLGEILLFHMAVRASRLTYATNYYFDISDHPFPHQEPPIPVSRENRDVEAFINHFNEMKIQTARKIMRKKDRPLQSRDTLLPLFFFPRGLHCVFHFSQLSER